MCISKRPNQHVLVISPVEKFEIKNSIIHMVSDVEKVAGGEGYHESIEGYKNIYKKNNIKEKQK